VSVLMDSPAVRVMEFERSFREAAAAGNPPDSLSRYTIDEVERFWAHTLPGLDGHVYWDGPKQFVRNDKGHRKPVRWVWERKHGPIPVTTDVWTTCGEPNCISPDHITAGRSPRRERFQRDHMLGVLQVAALRLGRPPTTKWWKERKMHPTTHTVQRYFGSWERYLRAAGLEPSKMQKSWVRATREEAVAAFRAVEEKIGHPPTNPEFGACREWLIEQGLRSSPTTIRRQLGCKDWPELLHKMAREPD
jgi:hypothetical protein